MAEEQKAIEPTTAKQRLILKLVAADKMVSGVYKDGENSFQHYVFQSEAAIKDAVKPALNSNGLTVVPKYTILGQRDVQTKKGIQHVVDVMGEFTISDGIESITGSMVASGADTLEKATAKRARQPRSTSTSSYSTSPTRSRIQTARMLPTISRHSSHQQTRQ
ncbi:ERF family protein [Lacticaseibacillus sharpeae]|uniref:ERF family protein n=1 Tax=Lacticaseibacillus sharpeae TaxID=1626 RepID=UPI0006CF3C8C